MVQRVLPFGQRSGPGTDLASALMSATAARPLAHVALAQIESRFPCRALRLVWKLGSAHDGPLRHASPESPPDPGETALIDAAFAAGAEIRAGLAGSDGCRLASVLGRPGARTRAVLVTEWPSAGALAQDEADWREYLAIVSARFADVLELAEHAITIEGLKKSERLQGALYAIADLASGELDTAEMLPRIHAVVGELMYAKNFFISLYSPERDALRFIYFADTQDHTVYDPEKDIPASAIKGSLALQVIRRGRSAMGPSAQVQAELGLEFDANVGPDSADWLGVPMMAEGQARGAVVVQNYERAGVYTEEDRALLTFVAQHILTALVRKQAHEELERRVEERTRELTVEVRERQHGERLQAALYAIADLASGELDMTEMLARIHAVVGELMYAKNFLIALYHRESDTLRFIYRADEKDPGLLDQTAEIPVASVRDTITFNVIRSGRAVFGAPAHVKAQLGIPAGAVFGTGAEHVIGVPMAAEGQVLGAVLVQSYDAAIHFSEDDRALLGYVAQHILTALLRKQAQAELEQRVQDRTRELREQIAERERIERQLLHETLHDSLTGLPNRSFLLDALARSLARLQRDPAHRFAVLFLDLDRFKVVNDSMGHLVGDEMLKEAARRLAACVRSPDIVARLGGDEFALLLEDIRAPDDAYHVAQRVLSALREPMRIAAKDLFPSASLGIALSHERYRSAEELLRDADVAMYRAKAKGRQRFEVFDEKLHQEALRLLDLESDLRRAVLREEFEPWFQPIVRLADGTAVGCEALLRWRHAQRGVMLPAEFLGVAEDSGAAEQIDWQIFDRTCQAIPKLLGPEQYVTLNVSARHFRSPELARQIVAMLDANDVAPRRVRLEVTEGALFENPEQACATLEALRAQGVLATLDDFGTGFSSLSYLHRFPLHALKIDRSFIAGLVPGSSSLAVVRAVLALAASLGLEVIAEGIETAAQRQQLIDLGCIYGQGFYFAHPRPAAEFGRGT
ncbi:MAG: EAL domain-containing protein [Gammaproteobacteria bacterium]